MIPKTYLEWYHCITVECSIPLTLDFILHRLDVLETPGNQETRRFISLYGKDHLNKIIEWFKKARNELLSQ